MPNINQNNEIEHINKEISLLKDRLKINKKKSESISKWVKANWKNTNKTRTKKTSFSNQENTKNIEGYI